MINFLKKYYQLLLIGILVILLSISVIMSISVLTSISVITRPEPKNNTIKEFILQQKVDSLSNAIELRNIKDKQHERNIILLNDSINKLSFQISKNNKEINKLRKKYQDVRDSVSKFTTGNINEYINQRYSPNK